MCIYVRLYINRMKLHLMDIPLYIIRITHFESGMSKNGFRYRTQDFKSQIPKNGFQSSAARPRPTQAQWVS